MRKHDAYFDEVCKDGESVRVGMLVMDALQRQVAQNYYQPRQAELTDEVRELRAATRAAYCSETEADMSRKKEALRDGDG